MFSNLYYGHSQIYSYSYCFIAVIFICLMLFYCTKGIYEYTIIYRQSIHPPFTQMHNTTHRKHCWFYAWINWIEINVSKSWTVWIWSTDGLSPAIRHTKLPNSYSYIQNGTDQPNIIRNVINKDFKFNFPVLVYTLCIFFISLSRHDIFN